MSRRPSEPHRVTEPIRYVPMRVRTDDNVTHAAYPEWRPLDARYAHTYCNQYVCLDKGSCGEGARRFCTRIEDDAVVDCMTCLTTLDRQEPW